MAEIAGSTFTPYTVVPEPNAGDFVVKRTAPSADLALRDK